MGYYRQAQEPGVASTETLTLDQANSWSGTFTGLLKNDATRLGHAIAYTVAEENLLWIYQRGLGQPD